MGTLKVSFVDFYLTHATYFPERQAKPRNNIAPIKPVEMQNLMRSIHYIELEYRLKHWLTIT